MNAASIDLGTNSIKLLIVHRDNDGQMHVLFRHRAVVRLGEGTFSKKGPAKISKNVQSRTMRVLQNYAKFLEAYKVDIVRATGTSALREAKNGPDFIKEVRSKTGIALESLSGDDEARLIVKGVLSELTPPKKPSLFIDIGGGSCELSVVTKHKVEKFMSLPLGAVRLTEQFLPGSKSKPAQLRTIDNYVKKYLKSKWPHPATYEAAYGSAGTIRALARLISKSELTDDQSKISRKQLERVTNKISKLSRKRISALPGIDSRRAEIITAGTRVLSAVCDHFKIKDIKVSNRGLREGLLVDLFEFPQKPNLISADLSADEALIIQNITKRYHSDRLHCNHVWNLSQQLFEELAPVHGISPKAKKPLMYACLMHDVGRFVSDEGSHKHTYYILRNTPMSFLSPQEKLLVAVLARYHKKSPPKPNHEGFSELNDNDQKLVMQLSSIMRIADALDGDRTQAVKWLKCQWGPGKLRINVEMKNGSDINEKLVKESAKPFEDIFKRDVTLSSIHSLKTARTQVGIQA